MLRTILLVVVLFSAESLSAAQFGNPAAARRWGESQSVVKPRADGLILCEGEEFQESDKGWQAQAWGENYYAATFANSFLSRKAFLGAPEQCDEAVAERRIQIPQAARYLVLVRYEAAFRFETQFRLQIEQDGKVVFNRLYGARKNIKIWPFGEGLKAEVGWSWGAVENIVWEGHNAYANLKPGLATIRLIAGPQPEPAARRNVDLVMLTKDADEVRLRLEKEKYLPLDGLLTQAGDVWLRVTNLGTDSLTFAGRKAPGGGNWKQHSPYWVHMRNWATPSLTIEPGQTSAWIDAGGAMDTLNDGQWLWTGNTKYKAEFGLRTAHGKIDSLATFTGEGDLSLAADADTRYSRRLRSLDRVLYDLLAHLKQEDPAAHGRAPRLTPVYAYTFDPLDDGRHAAAVAEFKAMFGLIDTKSDAPGSKGYIDVRNVKTDKLEEYCRNLGSAAKNIGVVSLGDEIRLSSPKGEQADIEFREWLRTLGKRPSDLDPAAGGDWSKISFANDESTRTNRPGLYYWSQKFSYRYGIKAVKLRTDILREHLPNAAVGANYSPHYPQEHMFLGEVYKWVTVFREDGMTLPWSEDYIWQVPVATPQMNHINFDLFRLANRGRPDRKIMYYVMPHAPNNTPRMWRRLFYGALGHGMKIVDLFEFRPVQVAYTENHVNDPDMYTMILGSLRELGVFEDIIQDGRVREAECGLWFSETADIWGDSRGSFAAGKRTLYTAIRHQQIPLDFVTEQDALQGGLDRFRVLYLADAHVSRSASQRIAEWVQQGGRLLATAGAGMYDELNESNTTLRELLGVRPAGIDQPEDSRVIWTKQDLPFARVIDHATMMETKLAFVSKRSPDPGYRLPVIGVRSRFETDGDCEVVYKYSDGSPAVASRSVGQGWTAYCGLLPGLSYYRPAIPSRPVDRGATEQAMIHLLPTEMDPASAALIAAPALSLARPVDCSEPLVESTVIEARRGVAVPLVNWTPDPIAGLSVTVNIAVPSRNITLASGGRVTVKKSDGRLVCTLDLDAADAIIFR